MNLNSKIYFPETLKYWAGVQQGQSNLMGRRCLFSHPSSDGVMIKMPYPETLEYWVGVQWGQSYLMGCLFSLGWPSF